MSHCEVIRDDNGVVIACAQVTGELSDETRAALRAVIEAARAMPVDPELQARYEASQQRIRERAARYNRRRNDP